VVVVVEVDVDVVVVVEVVVVVDELLGLFNNNKVCFLNHLVNDGMVLEIKIELNIPR
jgi:hypothetical protein